MLTVEELKQKMHNVPFGESAFKLAHFGENLSPERKYRHILLQINEKLNALETCKFGRMRLEIDIEEIEKKLETAEGFEKRRLEVDLQEKKWQLDSQEKLIEDAVIEVDTYRKILAQTPECTREQFEFAERDYWINRLMLDGQRELLVGGRIDSGTIKSLEQIGLQIQKNEQGQIVITDPAKQLEAKNEAM
jgi:hypothetical protein